MFLTLTNIHLATRTEKEKLRSRISFCNAESRAEVGWPDKGFFSPLDLAFLTSHGCQHLGVDCSGTLCLVHAAGVAQNVLFPPYF